jgi:transposase
LKNVNSRRRFSAEFKSQAVALLNAGKPPLEIAEDLEIGTGLLYRWRRTLSQPPQIGSGVRQAEGEENEADELRRLRRENATLQLENDILKKAAVILGTKSQAKRAR